MCALVNSNCSGNCVKSLFSTNYTALFQNSCKDDTCVWYIFLWLLFASLLFVCVCVWGGGGGEGVVYVCVCFVVVFLLFIWVCC